MGYIVEGGTTLYQNTYWVRNLQWNCLMLNVHSSFKFIEYRMALSSLQSYMCCLSLLQGAALDKLDINWYRLACISICLYQSWSNFWQKFNFCSFISVVCSSYCYRIWDLWRVLHYTDLNSAKLRTNVLVSSRLDYCNSLLTGTQTSTFSESTGSCCDKVTAFNVVFPSLVSAKI